MVAYEFYVRDQEKGDQLIGILPERRKKTERITQESIMNWVNLMVGKAIDSGTVFFIQVSVEKAANGNHFPIQSQAG